PAERADSSRSGWRFLRCSTPSPYFVAGITTSSAVVVPLNRSRAARTFELLAVTTQYACVLAATCTSQTLPGAKVAGGTGQLLKVGVCGVPPRSSSCTVMVMGFLSMFVITQSGRWPLLARPALVVRTVAAAA